MESRSKDDELQGLAQHARADADQEAADQEVEELRDRLRQMEAELAAASDQLQAARRDAHFLRMRVGVLQSYGDDLLIEISKRSADTITLAAEYDETLADRDRVIRETVSSFEGRVAVLIERIEILTLSGVAQRAADSERHERELAERDRHITSVLTSTSWKLTRPLRLALRPLRLLRALLPGRR